MANEIYDSTWWGNTIDTASSIGTSTEMIQGQFNLTKLGDELVTNGDFANGVTSWSTTSGSITVTDGEATVLGNSANGGVFQSIAQLGVTYLVEIEVLSINSGSWYAGGYITNTYSIDNVGKFSFYYTSIGTGFHILSSGGSGSITIDNVSVKQARATTVEASKCLADTIHRIGLQDIQN